MFDPIPECDDCRYKLWPAPCLHAAEGLRRKCQLVHREGREDYRRGLDRAMVGRPYTAPIAAGSAGLPAPAELGRLSVLVNRCRVREPLRCGCSDRRALCWRSGSPLERTGDQCVECVRGPA